MSTYFRTESSTVFGAFNKHEIINISDLQDYGDNIDPFVLTVGDTTTEVYNVHKMKEALEEVQKIPDATGKNLNYTFFEDLKETALSEDIELWRSVLPLEITGAKKEDYRRYLIYREESGFPLFDVIEKMDLLYDEMGVILVDINNIKTFSVHFRGDIDAISQNYHYGNLVTPVEDFGDHVDEYEVSADQLYDPLNDVPYLFTEMAKISLFNNKKLVKFCNEFGIPYGGNVIYKRIDSSDPMLNDYGYVLDINILITELRFMIELWNAIKNDDFEFMQRVSNLPDFATDKKVIKKHALRKLIKTIDIKAKGNRTFLVNDNILTPAVYFEDLSQVAFYQLYQAIYNQSDFKRCELCGSLFEVIHKGRRFCPPLPGRRRSSCENTYNRRKQRQKQKGE